MSNNSVTVTLLAFAAERRAATPLLLLDARRCQSIHPVRLL